MEVLNTFVFTDAKDSEKFDNVVEKFDELCFSETFERNVFRLRMQLTVESFDAFVMDLKLRTKTCNFSELQESMIRDQIVFGISDKKVRERLLREANLTLAGAIKICQASEVAQRHAKMFSECAKDQDTAAYPDESRW